MSTRSRGRDLELGQLAQGGEELVHAAPPDRRSDGEELHGRRRRRGPAPARAAARAAPAIAASEPGSRSSTGGAGQGADERLARGADDHRVAERREVAERGSRREVAGRRPCRSRCRDRAAPARAGMPAARAAAARSREERVHLGDHVGVARVRSASCAARRACASAPRRRRARRPAAASPGHAPRVTSLTITAPASSAAARDRGLAGVDRDQRRRGAAAPAPRSPATTRSRLDSLRLPARRRAGWTRRRRRARRRPRRSGARRARPRGLGSAQRPPSENESGVTLRIPITAGRPSAHSPAISSPVTAQLYRSACDGRRLAAGPAAGPIFGMLRGHEVQMKSHDPRGYVAHNRLPCLGSDHPRDRGGAAVGPGPI